MSPALVMKSIFNILAGPWYWRWDVSLVLGTAGLLYIIGWLHLRLQNNHVARFKFLLTYLAGLFTIAVALMSPIEALQHLLFFVHMFQHMLLMYLAAPLVLAGRALPFVLWGLPASLRTITGQLLSPNGWLRRSIRILTRPIVAFTISTSVLWLWHLPIAYNSVLVNKVLHDTQHLSFFAVALLYWWALIDSPPQRAWIKSNGGRGLYLALGAIQSAILGGLITFADRVIYTNYLLVPRLCSVPNLNEQQLSNFVHFCGIPALTDQQIAGAIMWFPGPLIFGLAAAFLMREE